MPTLGHSTYAWHVDLHEHMNMYRHHKQGVGINDTETPTFDLGQVRKPVAGFYWGLQLDSTDVMFGDSHSNSSWLGQRGRAGFWGHLGAVAFFP